MSRERLGNPSNSRHDRAGVRESQGEGEGEGEDAEGRDVSEAFDLAVIGSGFGGSLMACIARQLGKSVLLLEKGSHPRFVIGESSTPLSDLLWLELTRRYGLDSLVPFAKWGSWLRTYPEVGCGLKRGFSFYHHSFGNAFEARLDRSDQLLVGASPRDEIADTHWYRPEFDAFLVGEAIRRGVVYRDRRDVRDVVVGGGRSRIRTVGEHGVEEWEARFVIDAGQQGGALVRSLGLRSAGLPHLPETRAVYTHWRGVERLGELPMHDGIGDAPFPVDDAAVHHVFEGGWIWVLRFRNGVTSAGAVAVESIAKRMGFEDGESGWARLLEALPSVKRQFARASAVEDFRSVSGLGFRVEPAAGEGWALLPSAAGFVDPMLSSGFALTLLGIERLARAFEDEWDDPGRLRVAMDRYAREVAGDLLVLEDYVSALYARMRDFEAFTDVARLYFCAAIYAETARRMGRADDEGGYLAREHPELGRVAAAICHAARGGVSAGDLRRRVDSVLAGFDLGGLGDAGRRPWYPVRADDLREARGRIRATDAEWGGLIRMLEEPLPPSATGTMLST